MDGYREVVPILRPSDWSSSYTTTKSHGLNPDSDDNISLCGLVKGGRITGRTFKADKRGVCKLCCKSIVKREALL